MDAVGPCSLANREMWYIISQMYHVCSEDKCDILCCVFYFQELGKPYSGGYQQLFLLMDVVCIPIHKVWSWMQASQGAATQVRNWFWISPHYSSSWWSVSREYSAWTRFILGHKSSNCPNGCSKDVSNLRDTEPFLQWAAASWLLGVLNLGLSSRLPLSLTILVITLWSRHLKISQVPGGSEVVWEHLHLSLQIHYTQICFYIWIYRSMPKYVFGYTNSLLVSCLTLYSPCGVKYRNLQCWSPSYGMHVCRCTGRHSCELNILSWRLQWPWYNNQQEWCALEAADALH